MYSKDPSPYIVLVMDWTDTGAHWIKGFDTLSDAQDAVQRKVAEHQEIADRVVILKGVIEQIGVP